MGLAGAALARKGAGPGTGVCASLVGYTRHGGIVLNRTNGV